MSRKPSINSRKSPRRTYLRAVGVIIKGSYVVVDALEIGEGGILIRGELALELNDELVVSMMLPDGLGHAIARAQVKNRREVSGTKKNSKLEVAFGLQFLNMPLTSRRAIRNYVAAKTEAEARAASGN